jgi:uncharacterized membrane protein (UPF0127 family)
MQAGEGLLITQCDSIHTKGMNFPIDVLFLDGQGKIVTCDRAIAPGKMVTLTTSTANPNPRQNPLTPARSVLELPSGGALSTEVGDQITFTRL